MITAIARTIDGVVVTGPGHGPNIEERSAAFEEFQGMVESNGMEASPGPCGGIVAL